jgi:hypothetical protein
LRPTSIRPFRGHFELLTGVSLLRRICFLRIPAIT